MLNSVIRGIRSPREQEVLDKTIHVLIQHLDPNAVILFGSRAKGTAAPGADFDLAMDREKPEAVVARRIQEDIDPFAGLYGVDIVYLKNVDEAFRRLVLNTGQVVYERD